MMWAAHVLTLLVAVAAGDGAEEQAARPLSRHPGRGHGEQPEQFQQGSGGAGAFGQQSGQVGQDYRKIMAKYAGGYGNYTKYMPKGVGPSAEGGAASNASTPGFQTWLQVYVPAQDMSQYTGRWTSRWSAMSAPMEESYAKGNGGYMPYVKRYSSMQGKGVSSGGSWQDKMKSQEQAYTQAVGKDVPYHADRHVDVGTSAASDEGVDSTEGKEAEAATPAEAPAPDREAAHAPAEVAAPAEEARPASAEAASPAEAAAPASPAEAAAPAEEATHPDATAAADAALAVPDAPKQHKVITSPAMLLPAKAAATSFLAAAPPPAPEDEPEPDAPPGGLLASQGASRVSAWATASFGLLAVLTVVATRSLVSRRPAMSLEEQGFQLLVDA